MNTMHSAIISLIATFAIALGGCQTNYELSETRKYGRDFSATLIVVRHGDRDNSLVDELNATGRERANALVGALSGVQVDAIYIPDKKRNRNTAAPLAAERGLQPVVIETTNLADRLLARNNGKSVIWIGNKDNLTELWTELRAENPPPLEYGDLHILQLSGAENPKVTRSRFGP